MDVLQLADVFENVVEIFTREYKFIPLYSYSLPGYTWKAGLKLTNIKLDFIKDEHLLLLLEYNIRGGISSVMGDRHVVSDVQKTSYTMMQIFFMDGFLLNIVKQPKYKSQVTSFISTKEWK